MGLFDKFMKKTRAKMLAASDEELARRNKSKDRKKQIEREYTNGKKIMLVNNIWNDVSGRLEAVGYDVDDETDNILDALDALQMLLTENPHLVLIDVYDIEDEMLEYIDILHDAKPEIPILPISVPVEMRAAALEAGASYVLGRDFSQDELIDAVLKLIG